MDHLIALSLLALAVCVALVRLMRRSATRPAARSYAGFHDMLAEHTIDAGCTRPTR